MSGLFRGVFLTRRLYPRQDPDPQKHDRAHSNPMCGHMDQVSSINQSAKHDCESNGVESERHMCFPFTLLLWLCARGPQAVVRARVRLLFVPRHRSTSQSYCDELAFRFLTCRSFTTCCTFGTPAATFSALERISSEFTSPVSVTTPLFTSNFTASRILFWISAASRFFSMPWSRSEFTAFASFSRPTGITAI